MGVGRRKTAACLNNKTFSPLWELFGAGDPMFFQQFSHRVSGHFEQHLISRCLRRQKTYEVGLYSCNDMVELWMGKFVHIAQKEMLKECNNLGRLVFIKVDG